MPESYGEQLRRVDGLYVSYGQVLEQLGRLDERGDGWDRAHQAHKESLKEMGEAMLREIHKVEMECRNFHHEYRKDKEAEYKNRVSNRAIVIAMIAGSCTVLASIIGAAAAILTGG